MSWTLYVFIVTAINGSPVYLSTVVEGPVQFASAEACVARGRRYVSAQTKVICDSPDEQLEVQP